MTQRDEAQRVRQEATPRAALRVLGVLLALLPGCGSSTTQPPPPNQTVTWTRITDPSTIRQPNHPAWFGDSIAFDYEDATSHARLGTIHADGTGSTLFTDPEPCTDEAPAWVEDGLLVYGSDKGSLVPDNHNLWYRDLGSGAIRRLTSFAEQEFGPTARPGQPSLLYTEGADASHGRVTLIPDTSAATVTRLYLTPSSLLAGEASWDSAGNRVCYTVEDTDGTKHVWVITLFGNTVASSVQITTGPIHDSGPRFSPDGKKIVFASDRGGRSGVWWVSDTGEADRLELIAYEDPGAVIRAPSWSPDGKRIVLSSDGRGGRAIWILSNLGF